MMQPGGPAGPSWPTDPSPQQHGIPPDGQRQGPPHAHVSSLPGLGPPPHYVLPNPSSILPPPQSSMAAPPQSPYQPMPSPEVSDGRGGQPPPPSYAQQAADGRGVLVPPPFSQGSAAQQSAQHHALMRQPVPHSGLPAQPPPPSSSSSALPPLGRPSSPPSAAASTSPTEISSVSLTPDQQEIQRKNLQPFSSTDHKNRKYDLVVVQQPSRARMCGFGDKDRRPITPPPCVKLVVTDTRTGREIDVNNIAYTMFVMTVDLWSESALTELNLVRHTTATPTISSTTPASFSHVESAPVHQAFHTLMSQRDQQASYMTGYQAYGGQNGTHYAQGGAYQGLNGQMYPPNSPYYNADYRQESQPHGLPSPHGPHIPSQPPAYAPPRVFEPHHMSPQPRGSVSGQPQGMFTRNLIGSLSTSAFRLNDTDDRIGIWFVLQDLSVRTEGKFRLRFSFVDVSPTLGESAATVESPPRSQVYQGKAPILASTFSDTFTVYSAKKFPGVCESTSLSKAFAAQGIKIPIRKEGASGRNDDNDDYES